MFWLLAMVCHSCKFLSLTTNWAENRSLNGMCWWCSAVFIALYAMLFCDIAMTIVIYQEFMGLEIQLLFLWREGEVSSFFFHEAPTSFLYLQTSMYDIFCLAWSMQEARLDGFALILMAVACIVGKCSFIFCWIEPSSRIVFCAHRSALLEYSQLSSKGSHCTGAIMFMEWALISFFPVGLRLLLLSYLSSSIGHFLGCIYLA